MSLVGCTVPMLRFPGVKCRVWMKILLPASEFRHSVERLPRLGDNALELPQFSILAARATTLCSQSTSRNDLRQVMEMGQAKPKVFYLNAVSRMAIQRLSHSLNIMFQTPTSRTPILHLTSTERESTRERRRIAEPHQRLHQVQKLEVQRPCTGDKQLTAAKPRQERFVLYSHPPFHTTI
jgi:hypothetical protein